MLRRPFGRHQDELLEDPRRRWLIRHILKLQEVDDAADLGIVGEERDEVRRWRRGRIMYLPTRSASVFVLARNPAMNIEPRVPPGEKAVRPFGAQQLLVDKRGQDLVGEELSQPRVVDPSDLVEGTRLIRSALRHQEMEVRVDIYPVPKCLNGRNHSGHELAAG